jgi:hypothetical protein
MGIILVEHINDIMISLPIYIRVGKKVSDRFSLNLNTYRNAHFHRLSDAKTRFEEIVGRRISHLPVIAKAELTFSLFFGSKRHIDISNICCIVDKFFCDTLVNQGKLIDDNMEVISRVTYQWGSVDKGNPRIEVTLSNIQTVEDMKPMQILLTQQEIEEAIREIVLQQITIREDQGIAINFQQLKDSGLAAVVTIQKVGDDNNREAAPKKTRTRRTVQPEESIEEPAKAAITTSDQTIPESAKAAPAQAQPMPTQTLPIFAQPVQSTTPASAPAPKIFPDINTSAPVGGQASPPVGKSLFANLTKPIHDLPQE